MTKESKLVNKVKRLLKRLGCPRWLHHFGPKTYEFFEHFTALLIKAYCRLSYRRVKYVLDMLGMRCPSKSALQFTARKINAKFWQNAIKSTCGNTYLAAIDSTGLSRTNPSYYYLRRIDGSLPRMPIKLSVAFDTRRKKFSAAKVRLLSSHDINDAKSLISLAKPNILVADKAYDASWLHDQCKDLRIKAHIPLRKWGKPRARNWSARMLASKKFNIKTYHRRELVEAGFSSLKRKYGNHVSSKKARTIRTEVYGRIVCHNIFSWLFWTFRTEPE